MMIWVSAWAKRLATDYFILNKIDTSNEIVVRQHRCFWFEDADNFWWQNKEIGDKFWLFDIIAQMITVKSYN